MNFSPAFAPRVFPEAFLGCRDVFEAHHAPYLNPDRSVAAYVCFDEHGYDAALAVAAENVTTFANILSEAEADFRSAERDTQD